MFKGLRDKMRGSKEAREKSRQSRERMERAREDEMRRARAMDEERERRTRAIRIITGEVKYRYAVIDTIRSIGYCESHGEMIDPDEATRRAIERLQDQAFKLGADAVIHAQYNVMRYTVQRRQMNFSPVYETHLFGTAIKVLGPPVDWDSGGDETVVDGEV